ncbi:hypothetical protein ABPG75_011373 [Micractinium tetrahymenae]
MSSFVLQTTNQSLAHRLWRYATASRDGTFFYPEGICEEAVEVAPCTDKVGPCLVLFSGCKLAPAELNTWIYAGASSNAAVVRAYWLGASPGKACSREDLVAQLRAAGPPPDGGALRLQCAPRSLEGWLADQLGPAFNLQPVKPTWVLNVVCMAADGGEDEDGQQQREQREHRRRPRILYSLQPASSLYNYSPVKDKRIPDQLSKAAGKLAEALQACGLQLTSGVAVDLGAAPGGWTHVLAQHARRVIAVDPAPLDPRALACPAVTHLACKAEDAVDAIKGMVGEAGVDLLVSDVNRHPSQVIGMMRPLLPLLHPGAAVILTLKFHGKSAGREAEFERRLADELGPEFGGVRLLWLLANTQHEQTCVAWKAAAPPAGAAANGVAAGL